MADIYATGLNTGVEIAKDATVVKDYSDIIKNNTGGTNGWLKAVPEGIDTSTITNFDGFFTKLPYITTIPLINTSRGTNFNNMFQNDSSLVSIPLLDVSRGTNFNYFFNGCSLLTNVPALDTSRGINFGYFFGSCSSLKIVPALNCSSGTSFSEMFYRCSNLEEIHAFGFTRALNISVSTKFTESALIEILNNLGNAYNNSQRLTMGATNIAKLTSEEGQTALTNAQSKGWTIV